MLLRTAFTWIALSLAIHAADTTWLDAKGAWDTASAWSARAPSALDRVTLRGTSQVLLSGKRAVVGSLHLGINAKDECQLEVEQAELIVRRGMLQIGELKSGSGCLLLRSGAVHCVSVVYVGGANAGPDRGGQGELVIHGGSFLSRMLALGWGTAARATLAIHGSQAQVQVLDSISCGVYEADQQGSECLFHFTLDDKGVSPLVIQGTREGLTLHRKAPGTRHLLRISLSATPPSGAVPLLCASVPTKGEFDSLPEGAKVTANYGGRQYEWQLTYTGGKSKSDIVLLPLDAATSPHSVRAMQQVKPLWTQLPLRSDFPAKAEPAFPGAEGFGSVAKGGRGGKELWVRSLEDSGPGTLREAVMQKGPRSIRFKLGGELRLKSRIIIKEPCLSILGESAPVPGITLLNHGVLVQSEDVVLRHLRIRSGESSAGQDALEIYDSQRCIVDHCSIYWGDDEVCSVVGLSDCITLQHCIIAEGLNHKQHSMASLAGGERVTWHHNLIAHCGSRNPRFAGVTSCDFRNNLVYNWGHTASYGEWERLNFVGNVYLPGPSTRPSSTKDLFKQSGYLLKGSAYVKDNLLSMQPSALPLDAGVETKSPFAAPAVRTTDATTAYDQVLKGAGTTSPQRDSRDARLIEEVLTRKGAIPELAPRTTN